MSHYEWNGQDLQLRLKVLPRSARDTIDGLLGDRLKVRITAPPVDGKANAHLIGWLSKLCGIPRSNIRITAGQTSRNKTVAIHSPRQLPPQLQIAASENEED